MTTRTFIRHAGRVVLLLTVTLAAAGTVVVRAANPDDVKKLHQTQNCPGCDLTRTDLTGLQARGANLENADFTASNLYKAVLRGSDLTGALFLGANLSGADLTHARGAHLNGAITDSATICPNGKNGPCN